MLQWVALRLYLLQRQLLQRLPLLLHHQGFRVLMTAWVRSTLGAVDNGVHELPAGLAAIADLLFWQAVVPAAQASYVKVLRLHSTHTLCACAAQYLAQ